MIPAETWYKTHDGKLLAIVKVFKTWRHYLKDCKHKVLMLIDSNNFQHFMDTKSWSSWQVHWAQKLSKCLVTISSMESKEEETLRAKNTKILHQSQSLLAWVSGLNVLGMSVLGLRIEVSSFLHQVLICRIAVLPQLRQFWDDIRSQLAHKGPYTANIRAMRMRLSELEDDNKKAKKKLRSKGLPKVWEDLKEVFHYEDLLFVPKVICLELISKHHNNLLAGYFDIEKTREMIACKYYWLMQVYVKGYDVCLVLKSVRC